MRILRPSRVTFANDKIEKEFNRLDESDEIKNISEERWMI